MFNGLNSAYENALAFFSPKKAISRHFDRRIWENMSKRRQRWEKYEPEKRIGRNAKYAAAKTTRLTGDWSPTDASVNEIIRASNPTIRRRTRQLIRDFPFFERAVSIMVDYSVGDGIRFQSKVRGPDNKANKPLRQKIEDSLQFWMDKADVSGRMHFYEIMRLQKRQDMEAGEFIIVETERRVKDRFAPPFALQVFETDWLTDYRVTPASKENEVDQGIEYRKDTGEILYYHFQDPDSWGKTKRVEASRVHHKFEVRRPMQLRGVSPFAPAILLTHDLQDYMDATIDTAKFASKWLAIVSTERPHDLQSGLSTETETGRKIEELENAIIEYLRPGEQIHFPSQPGPGDNFTSFVRLILTMISITIDVPYELLSGDYKDTNYSRSKMSRNDFAQQLRPISARHVRHFALPCIRGFFDSAVLDGKLRLPNYFSNPLFYQRGVYQPPGMELIDPYKETLANIKQMAALIRSPQEIVSARGGDLETVIEDIAEAVEMASDAGLSYEDLIKLIGSMNGGGQRKQISGGN